MVYKSKVDIVYDYIIEQISNSTYRNGDRLVISRIATACGVSDIPVREALRRLESNGFVKLNANQGAIVIGFSAETVIEIIQTKGVLEAYATRLCVDYLSAADIAELSELNEQLREAADAFNSDTYSDLNLRFHMRIYSKLRNRELKSAIESYQHKWTLTQQVFRLLPSRMAESYDEHRHILALIEAQKYEDVERFVREHKFKAVQAWIPAPVQPDDSKSK